jgi:hypothetical protein
MPIGSRRDGTFYAVSATPDVCLTPRGAGMVPVPYQIICPDFSSSEKVAETVRFNGAPAFQWSHSLAPPVVGDEPGTGGGVKSGVNTGKGWAEDASINVRAERRRVVRHGDRAWLNVKK